MTVYEHGGARVALRWSQRHAKGSVFLLDENFEDLLGKAVPADLLQLLSEGGSAYIENGQPRTVYKVLGQEYWVIGEITLAHPRHRHREQRLAPFFPFRSLSAFLALLITGQISYLLSRHLTSPVQGLRVAVKLMASGDLSARTAEKITRRRDELGELAQDFNGMAEEIERLIRKQHRLLGDVSHELRSPLARLQVALGLARKAAGQSCEKNHDRIEKEVERLDELIGQVISLVRLDTSSKQLNKVHLNLAEILTVVVNDAVFEAASQNKRVQLSVAADFEILGDVGFLSSALENVVRNAVAYAQEFSIVEVRLAVDEGRCIISVLDQGPGVSEAALEFLFEPFYREADARDRASDGYGLGLVIAQRAVRLHGGDISARNRAGAGLEVNISLP